MDTARRAYNEAVARRVGLPGAEYRLALLAIQRGDIVDADLHLVHSTAAGEMVAGCDYIRATFAGSQGNFGEAGRQLEGATRAEPFNGKWYFCWGECLRRQGKPRAALAVLEQALDRPFSREEGDLYVFKIGLAKIEAGGDDEFNAALDQHLQQKNVPGDWLLLAAARELDRAAYPAAAEYLAKAEKVMPPELFDVAGAGLLLSTRREGAGSRRVPEPSAPAGRHRGGAFHHGPRKLDAGEGGPGLVAQFGTGR